MRRFDDAREMSSVPGALEAGAVARDEPVEDPRAIEETSEIEAERATGEEDPTAAKDINGETLSDEDLRVVEQLKQRDSEVRAHEQAHVTAGGGHITSGPSYSYQTGPDGKRYAIGGEVGIDTSMKAGDPEGNLEKARAIIRAAMAPAEPSSQDVRVAASARAMETRAQQEIRDRQIKEYEAVMDTGATDRASAPSGTAAATTPTANDERSGSATQPSQGMSGGQERPAQRIEALFSTSSVETGLSRLA
ncbi:hypothetical protein Atep_16840 [Allochromatium tepidum]|uniref:SrpA-related protein n=2 Tax=Allochromatium tepidum TaxID=553982 RepID=A0ABM7QMN9_9GAMM|nr:hypothetical protein Atep_16840 [Allochromatium tepidum]